MITACMPLSRKYSPMVQPENGMHAVIIYDEIGSRCRDDDRIVERALLLEHPAELHHGRTLLPDRHIDTIELDLFVARGVERLLIENRVERDRGLAGLAVADDQFALAAADGNKRIDGLEPG